MSERALRWFGAIAAALVLLDIAAIVHMQHKLASGSTELQYKKIEADDKRRERDTCLGWVKERDAKIAKLEADLNKCSYDATEAANTAESCDKTNYRELFNVANAGVIASNVVLYQMDDKELKKYCNTNWEVSIGKNYPGAKLVGQSTMEIGHSRSGSLFLVTCDWLVPSVLWCNKGKIHGSGW